jgi:hypothetical protein
MIRVGICLGGIRLWRVGSRICEFDVKSMLFSFRTSGYA